MNHGTVAFATCAEWADGHPDDLSAARLLADAGVSVEAVTWDDPAADWSRFDLTVVRSTWDYPPRRDRFLVWAASVPRLANPVTALDWSSDKHYLGGLAAAGIPTVTSLFVEPDDDESALAEAISELGDLAAGFVVKPAVGAGSVDAGRYRPLDADGRGADHARRLLADGRSVLLQPYLATVEAAGETELVYLGGDFSHAVRKEALLDGPAGDVDGLFKEETVAAIAPTGEQLTIATSALDAGPVAPESLLYARVDLLDGPCGGPVVLEVELVEPSLFLTESDNGAARFAAVIVEWTTLRPEMLDRC